MECAAQQALAYQGPGNVLVAWEHVRLPKVSEFIGADNVPTYPGEYTVYTISLSHIRHLLTRSVLQTSALT